MLFSFFILRINAAIGHLVLLVSGDAAYLLNPENTPGFIWRRDHSAKLDDGARRVSHKPSVGERQHAALYVKVLLTLRSARESASPQGEEVKGYQTPLNLALSPISESQNIQASSDRHSEFFRMALNLFAAAATNGCTPTDSRKGN